MLNRKKKSIIKNITMAMSTLIVASNILSSSVYAASFSDVQNHWSRDYVENLSSKSIINGYNDGSFRPDNRMTREEASNIIYKYILKETSESGDSKSIETKGSIFSDMVKERWSFNAINYLSTSKVIAGYPNGTFQPEREISRAEYSKLVYMALESLNKIDKNSNEGSSSAGKELTDIKSHWAEDYIVRLTDMNAIKGYLNGEFRPDNSITRAEASSILSLLDDPQLGVYKSTGNYGIGTGLTSASQGKNTAVNIETVIKYSNASITNEDEVIVKLDSVNGNHSIQASCTKIDGQDKFLISFDEKNLNPGELYRFNISLGDSKEQLYAIDINKNAILGRVYSEDNRVFYKRDMTQLTQLTVENLLRKAIEPVGKTLYVWGGGWNEEDTGPGPDAVTVGISQRWIDFYNRYGSEYNYNNTRFQIRDGLDCSGYIGWIIYNTLNTENNKDGYVMLADRMARDYSNRGWGHFENIGNVTDYKPGDIMSSSSHVYMVLGKAEDGSVVLVHSSPSGVQINGTPSPYSSGTSRAQILAQNYMNKYYRNFTNKFPGMNRDISYLRNYERMSWNTDGNALLTDPQGIRNMNAEEVLKHLFNE